MRTTLFRILRNGGLVAVALFAFGSMFGQLAGMFVSGQATPRGGPVMEVGVETPSALPVADGLSWRMPAVMAGWGFLLVAGYEVLAGIWRRPVETTPTKKPVTEADKAEAAVQQFLREAEAKQTNLANTPAPQGTLKPETANV